MQEDDTAGFDLLYGIRDESSFEGMTLRDSSLDYSSPQKDRNGLRRETYKLALEVVRLSSSLREERHYELASQFLRSGTAPGALSAEYFHAESDRDRRHKLAIALKEANECKYWTCLLRDSGILPPKEADPLIKRINTVLSTLKFFHKKN